MDTFIDELELLLGSQGEDTTQGLTDLVYYPLIGNALRASSVRPADEERQTMVPHGMGFYTQPGSASGPPVM